MSSMCHGLREVGVHAASHVLFQAGDKNVMLPIVIRLCHVCQPYFPKPVDPVNSLRYVSNSSRLGLPGQPTDDRMIG